MRGTMYLIHCLRYKILPGLEFTCSESEFPRDERETGAAVAAPDAGGCSSRGGTRVVAVFPRTPAERAHRVLESQDLLPPEASTAGPLDPRTLRSTEATTDPRTLRPWRAQGRPREWWERGPAPRTLEPWDPTTLASPARCESVSENE